MANSRVLLKNVKTFRGREGIGLNADVYFDGVKTAFVIDHANGGNYSYESYGGEYDREKFKELTAYVNTLPDKIYPKDEFSEKFSCKMSVDILVDEAFEEYQKENVKKKMEKAMLTKILVGIPNGTSYGEYNYKKLLSSFKKEELQASIDRIKSKLKPGEIILNTNLLALGIKL